MIAEILRSSDYASYLISIFVSQQKRLQFQAINAFAHKISSLKHKDGQVKNIKILYFRSLINEIYAGKTVNDPIGKVFQSSTLSKTFFLNLLRDYRHDSIESLEATAEAHFSSKLYLLLQSLDINNHSLDHVTSHLGKAIGLSRNISDLFMDLNSGQVPIPPTIMHSHGLSEESLLDTHELFSKNRPVDPQTREKLQNVIFELSTRANDHLLTSKAYCKDLLEKQPFDGQAIPVLLYMLPLEMYLKDLEKSDFDLFDKKLEFGYDKKRFTLPFRLYSRARDPLSFSK